MGCSEKKERQKQQRNPGQRKSLLRKGVAYDKMLKVQSISAPLRCLGDFVRETEKETHPEF